MKATEKPWNIFQKKNKKNARSGPTNPDLFRLICKTSTKMNKKYLITAIVTLLTLPVFAQTERVYEYDEYGKVGRSEGWARRFAHNFVDGLMGAEYYEVYDNNGNKTESKSDDPKTKKNVSKSYRYYGPGHTPDFYFGINLLCTDRPPVLTPDLPQKPGKGFEFGFAIGQWGYHMTKNIGVNTALYLTRSRYWFDKGQYLNYNINKDFKFVNDPIGDREVKQGYLRYWSLRVPLCLEISSASSRGPFIAVGPEIEYRFGDVSIVEYQGGKSEKLIKGTNVNPLGLNAVLRVGISDFGLIARYSFNSLFLNDQPLQTYPFMIGVSTTF